MKSFPLEWVEVSPGIVLVATPEQGWVYRPGEWNEFAIPMRTPGTPETARTLLETARRAGRSEGAAGMRPLRLSAGFWAWYLCGSYVTTRDTPPLLREAATRLARAGRERVARWAEQRAVEEECHDELALRDLRALGIDAERAVQHVVPPQCVAQAELFSRYVHQEDPLEAIGFAFAVEGMSAGIGEDAIRYIEQHLPPGVNATRCLRVHSALGVDVRHLAETVQVVSELTAEERIRVTRACFETARTLAGSEAVPDEQTLQAMFMPFKLAPTA